MRAPVFTSDALREFDCGDMEGRGDEEAWAAHHNVTVAWANGDYAHYIPGGESFLDMQTRFVPFIQGLLQQHSHKDGAILLIGHGSLLHMLPLVLTNVNRAFIDQHGMPNCVYIFTVVEDGKLVCRQWEDDKLMG
ncbi:MAG: histidine phosphatase family protein [Caldilineaceae bacterium]